MLITKSLFPDRAIISMVGCNDIAIKFYKVMGYICEDHSSSSDPASMKYPTLIFSKSSGPYSVESWNNRYINPTDQMKKIILKEEKTYG